MKGHVTRMLVISDHEQLAAALSRDCQPWRAMIVGIDGRDGEGKSRLARFLAWRLEMPCLETDTFLQTRTGTYAVKTEDLRRAVRTRLDLKRPVIVEGVFLLRTLELIGESVDRLVYVNKEPANDTSGFEIDLANYRSTFRPEARADYSYRWADPDYR